jgi:hypothetical protein
VRETDFYLLYTWCLEVEEPSLVPQSLKYLLSELCTGHKKGGTHAVGNRKIDKDWPGPTVIWR